MASTAEQCQVTGSALLHGTLWCKSNSKVTQCSVPDKFKPAIFNNGVQVAFPWSTKRLKKLVEACTFNQDILANAPERHVSVLLLVLQICD